MSKKISVIVPIYNTVKQLKKCLNSIKNQSYKNLEIICIDDGSSDGSEKLVDEVAKNDERFIVIHQANSGESNARNRGLELASGDVITFVDCDDWLEVDMYENLIGEMDNYDLDIVAGSWCKEFEDECQIMTNSKTVSEGVFGKGKFLEYIYMRDSYQGFAYMWNKLYKRTVLTDENGELIMFDTSLLIGGDVLYLAQAALNANRIKYIDRPFYHYYQRATSGIHTQNTNKMRDWIKAYLIVIELLEKSQADSNTINYARRFMAYHASNGLKIAIEQQDEKAKLYFKSIMEKQKNIYFKLNEDYPKRIEEYRQLLNE